MSTAAFTKTLYHCLLSRSADVREEWADGGVKDGLADVDEAVSFNYTINNDGSTLLMDFCLTDANLGSGCLECAAPGTGILAPRDSFTCGFLYKVGWISNRHFSHFHVHSSGQ